MAPVMSKPVAFFSREELLSEVQTYRDEVLCAFVTLCHPASSDELRRGAASFLCSHGKPTLPGKPLLILC